MGGQELEFVKDAFASNWIAPLGPYVAAFEKEICTFTQAGHAVALSSGTAAMHLALINLGVDMGDLVICATHTFIGSANPILYQRAIPVFIDSDETDWNMNPYWLEKAIRDQIETKGKKPKAIIAVHIYGMPARMTEIMAIAAKYEIPVIEDAAEALGSCYRGRHVGTMGCMGILSFNGNKIITTSGGGALFSNHEPYVQRARFLSEQAREAALHYQHGQIGYNYRLSNICAAIGCGQMQVINQRVQQRRQIFEFYRERLSAFPGLAFQAEPDGALSNRWLSCITLDSKMAEGIDRNRLVAALQAENIDCRPLFKPMHLQPVFSGAPFYGDGVADRLFEQGVCLPSGSQMTEEDLHRVVDLIQHCIS